MSAAADFIREWNRTAIQRNGGVVITPRGQITAETAEQIEIARTAGHAVRFVTGRAGHDEQLTDRHGPEPPDTATASPSAAAPSQTGLNPGQDTEA